MSYSNFKLLQEVVETFDLQIAYENHITPKKTNKN